MLICDFNLPFRSWCISLLLAYNVYFYYGWCKKAYRVVMLNSVRMYQNLSRFTAFPTWLHVLLAKVQISLRISALCR